MTDEDLPHDPFAPDGDGALGALGQIIGEGAMLKDALREAADRGRLYEAVCTLDLDDLSAIVFSVVMTEKFRAGLRAPAPRD